VHLRFKCRLCPDVFEAAVAPEGDPFGPIERLAERIKAAPSTLASRRSGITASISRVRPD
jgi:hypothetical protein